MHMEDTLIPTPGALATIRLLPVERWRERLGEAVYQRALKAVEHNAISDVSWLSDDLVLARVSSGGIRSRVSIAVNTEDSDVLATCVCPTQYDCEHALTLALYLRARVHERERTLSWQERFDTVVLATHAQAQGEPMGLHVEYSPYQEEIWLTPLRRGVSRPWVKKRASWSELFSSWASVTDGLNPQHLEVLQYAWNRATHGENYYRRLEIPLSVLGAHAFEWLSEAHRRGITFIRDMYRFEQVEIDTQRHRIALNEQVTTRGITVTAQRKSATDAAPQHPTASPEALIGDVAVYRGGELLRGLRAGEQHDPLEELGKVSIPWKDTAHYLAYYAPGLRRQYDATETSDFYHDHEALESAPLAAPPTLIGRLGMADGGRSIAVSWHVQYEVGQISSECALHTNAGETVIDAVDARVGTLYRIAAAKALRTIPSWELWPASDDDITFKHWRFPAYRLREFVDLIESQSHTEGVYWDLSGIDVETLSGVESMEEVGQIFASVQPTGDMDWFDLETKVLIRDIEVPLASLLLALAQGQPYMFVGGRWVDIDTPRMWKLKEALEAAAALGPDKEHPRISRWQAHLWSGLDSIADQVSVAPQWSKKIAALPASGELPALPLVESGTVSLRHYQEDGHRWLTSLMQAELGGVLADDMGLGKTVQVLAAVASYIEARKDAGVDTPPIVVVAPTSVVPVWAGEAQRWYPHLRVRTLNETAKKRGRDLAEEAQDADIVVASYGIVRLDSAQFAPHTWGGCIIDEAHTVKNPRTAAFRTLRDMERPWTLALTGTPVENSVTDLWAIFRLACPGLLPGWERFKSQFVTPIERRGDTGKSAILRQGVAPFMLRRTKEAVATDLPEKTDSVLPVPMEGSFKRFYDALLTRERARILGLLDAGPTGRVEILASLTRLRQAALDPTLLDEAHRGGLSPKTQALVDVLTQIVPAGHQALVFSQFTSYLDRIEVALKEQGIDFVRLDGSTRRRQQVIEKFRDGQARVFLISLKAGGTGLTLTEADYVFMMDPWWNPKVEEQAIDRAHRIGQTKPVTIYRLVSAGTIEEKVLALQERKRAIADALILADQAHAGRLTAEDIRALLT